MKKYVVIGAALFVIAASAAIGYQFGKRPAAAPVSVEYTAVSPVSQESYMSDTTEITSQEIIFRLDLNTATAEQLTELDGIGEELAGRIIAYRDEHYFNSVDELKNVYGIGDAIVENNRDKLTVVPVETNVQIPTETTSSYTQTSEQPLTVTSVGSAVPETTTTASAVTTVTETPKVETTTSKVEVRFPLDINSATEEELVCLDGVGETLARRIVAYREINGGYYSVYELLEVSGIGEPTLDKFIDNIYADTDGLPPRETTTVGGFGGLPTVTTTETSATTTEEIYRVNLNTASLSDLTQLPISEETAESIIALRNQIGSFSDTRELLLADGMTNAIYNKIKQYVYV